jgi:hypothetical protein
MVAVALIVLRLGHRGMPVGNRNLAGLLQPPVFRRYSDQNARLKWTSSSRTCRAERRSEPSLAVRGIERSGQAIQPHSRVPNILGSTRAKVAYMVDQRIKMNQNESKSGMIRWTLNKLPPVPIHSRLEPGDHERLTTLADQQDSSVARMVKLAVIEFLDRHAPADVPTSDRPNRASRRG